MSLTMTECLVFLDNMRHDPWFYPFLAVFALWILGVTTMLRIAVKGGGKSL